MLQGQSDADIRHKGIQAFRPDPCKHFARHWRRDQFHGRHGWLPTHEQWGMGNLHLDRAVQIMRGVRLRQVPTVFGQGGEKRHRE